MRSPCSSVAAFVLMDSLHQPLLMAGKKVERHPGTNTEIGIGSMLGSCIGTHAANGLQGVVDHLRFGAFKASVCADHAGYSTGCVGLYLTTNDYS